MSPAHRPPHHALADPSLARPLRSDARRNREKLLAAARAAFAGADAGVPLEEIAASAGVGIGTLYRHFPTREALVEAVYATEIDELTTSAPTLLAQMHPEAALRAWMERYGAFAAAKRGMADTLRAGWASGRITTAATRARITAAIASILTAGAADGTLRADVSADDVTAMVLGVFLSTAAGQSPDQSARLLDLVVDALRTSAAP